MYAEPTDHDGIALLVLLIVLAVLVAIFPGYACAQSTATVAVEGVARRHADLFESRTNAVMANGDR